MRKNLIAERWRKFSAEAFSRRMFGFAASRAWVFLVFFNGTVLVVPENPNQVLSAIYQGSLVALVCTLAVVGLLNERMKKPLQTRVGRTLPAFLCIIGTSAIPVANLVSPVGLGATALAAFATGIGSGLMIVLWGMVYCYQGGSSTAAEVSVAYTLAAIPAPFYVFWPLPVQLIVVALLPVVSTLLLIPELKKHESSSVTSLLPNDETHASLSTEDASGAEQLNTGRFGSFSYRGILVKFTISSLVFGCIISMTRAFSITYSSDMLESSIALIFPLSALLASCVMVGILIVSTHLDFAFSYKTVLIFMVIGCLFLPLFSVDVQLYRWLSYAFSLAGYFCFEIVSWVMLSDMIFRFDTPPFRTYGFGRAAVSGGVLCGACLAQFLLSFGILTLEFRFVASCIMVLVLIVTHTLTLTERDIARLHRRARNDAAENVAAGGTEAGESGVSGSARAGKEALTLEDRVQALAARMDISGREYDVMLLLAQGRSAARIEKELYISRGTVNTYSHRLYQKLNIHSRQELLDLIYEVHES